MSDSVFVSISMSDGSVALMQFVVQGRGSDLPYGATWVEKPTAGPNGRWRREPTDENLFQEISRSLPLEDAFGNPQPAPTRYRIIDVADIPPEREYRNALVDEGTKLAHDMEKARVIHIDNVRVARAAKLERLDRDWTRAVGQGNALESARVEAERQTLRDLPKTLGVEKAKTVGELRVLWPTSLEDVK